ncbi:hypothetical protein [Cupriavidus sp. BIC8F]|uniref:hypothetical protein n=1 Tax=Cupriavidus sp. BIC8F TaxID=3079014 RepID=UPI002916206F|nr:hypothetical protein [Cupriavidus sp. BIC8F]
MKNLFGGSMQVEDHVQNTYKSLRLGLAVLAIALPVLLYGIGKGLYGLELQRSMSAYFFAATARQCSLFPLRTVFVGVLCAISVGLYLYKGFSWQENLALNAAGIFGTCVALFPERLDPDDARLVGLFRACPDLVAVAAAQQGAMPVHFLAAGAMFACLAYVAIFRAKDTLQYLPLEKTDDARERRKRRYARTYRALGGLMVAFPLVGLVLSWVMGQRYAAVFFVEAAGIWTFGAYWIVKSKEMARSTKGERQVAEKMTADKGLADAHATPSASPVFGHETS